MSTILRHDDAGRVVGEMHHDERPGNTIELHLDVAPARQRTGVGRSMLAELEALADERNVVALYTFCAWDNEKAKAFFAATGFTLTLAVGFYGHGRDAYLCVKPLRRPE